MNKSNRKLTLLLIWKKTILSIASSIRILVVVTTGSTINLNKEISTKMSLNTTTTNCMTLFYTTTAIEAIETFIFYLCRIISVLHLVNYINLKKHFSKFYSPKYFSPFQYRGGKKIPPPFAKSGILIAEWYIFLFKF